MSQPKFKSSYIIWLSLVAGAACLCGVMYQRSSSRQSQTLMRVAFPYDRKSDTYDPAHITLAPEYIFIENTYSPLIEMDAHGVVAPGVASHFEWAGGAAVLTIRDDLFTVDGYRVTAMDAEASLKRLLVLTGNTHGIQDLLCKDAKISHLSDPCAGIKVNGNRLILDTGGNKPFLFSMLTSIDFAVIPKISFDQNTLKIIDYRNTSGPYYVSEDEGSGHITLKANPRHYHYDGRIAQEIRLVPMDRANPSSSLLALESGQVDVVTTVDAVMPGDAFKFYESRKSKFSFHASQDIRNFLLVFTEKGRLIFTPQQRFWIGKKMREAFARYAGSSIAYKTTHQFLPAFGEGGLSMAQLGDLENAYNSTLDLKISGKGLKATHAMLGMHEEFDQMLQSILPGIELTRGKIPDFAGKAKNPADEPVMWFYAPDVGFLEDLSLISWSLSAGLLNIPKAERTAWLSGYTDLQRKEDRIARLNSIHFSTLMDPTLVPLAVGPYVALATKEWEIGLSKLYANNQLWTFKHK